MILQYLSKKRLRIGRDSSRLLREDKIANPLQLYYREVREQCKFILMRICTATIVVRIS